MSFKEWLNDQCNKRSVRIKDVGFYKGFKFDRLMLNSGLSLSVQASEFHNCDPAKTLDTNEYETVEVYTSGQRVDELIWYESDKHTFSNVPISVMEKICEKNGGIKV